MFGCAVGLSELMNGMSVVAMGTSLPDTFASRMAAMNDDNADAAVGNVMGSNCVNVFLGLGIPWVIVSLYYQVWGRCGGLGCGTWHSAGRCQPLLPGVWGIVVCLGLSLRPAGHRKEGGVSGVKVWERLGGRTVVSLRLDRGYYQLCAQDCRR